MFHSSIINNTNEMNSSTRGPSLPPLPPTPAAGNEESQEGNNAVASAAALVGAAGLNNADTDNPLEPTRIRPAPGNNENDDGENSNNSSSGGVATPANKRAKLIEDSEHSSNSNLGDTLNSNNALLNNVNQPSTTTLGNNNNNTNPLQPSSLAEMVNKVDNNQSVPSGLAGGGGGGLRTEAATGLSGAGDLYSGMNGPIGGGVGAENLNLGNTVNEMAFAAHGAPPLPQQQHQQANLVMGAGAGGGSMVLPNSSMIYPPGATSNVATTDTSALYSTVSSPMAAPGMGGFGGMMAPGGGGGGSAVVNNNDSYFQGYLAGLNQTPTQGLPMGHAAPVVAFSSPGPFPPAGYGAAATGLGPMNPNAMTAGMGMAPSFDPLMGNLGVVAAGTGPTNPSLNPNFLSGVGLPPAAVANPFATPGFPQSLGTSGTPGTLGGVAGVAGAAAVQFQDPAISPVDGFPLSLPRILAHPDDTPKLSNHQLLLRHQIEAFIATEDDASTHTRGRNKPVMKGQVGIRCRHCKHLPILQRQKGATYFPNSLLGIYQAAQNMNTVHMQCGLCTEMPGDVKHQFVHSMCYDKVHQSGAGRPYWAEAAKKLGLVDTENHGIRFIREIPSGATVMTTIANYEKKTQRNIERPPLTSQTVPHTISTTTTTGGNNTRN